MTPAPNVPNRHASGTLRFGFSTAAEFCAADSIPRNAHKVSEMLEPIPAPRLSPWGFHAAENVALLNQNQPMIDSRPTGSMMMPEPIMFTATMNVSWTRDIFFIDVATVSSALFGHAVDVIGTVVLLSPFDFLGKAWELLAPLLHRAQVGEPRTVCRADVL